MNSGKRLFLVFVLLSVLLLEKGYSCCYCKCYGFSCAAVYQTLGASTIKNILDGYTTDTTQFVYEEGNKVAKYIFLIRKAFEERDKNMKRRKRLQERMAILNRAAIFWDESIRQIPLAEVKALNAEANLLMDVVDTAIAYSENKKSYSDALRKLEEVAPVQR